eukprot:TRINITY_DN9597_c0_g1_i1.p1 TRINITY_DN9597_c0_g1~~TRINITY_DN9597_c0_g1_i1.p1  ORF type:complete len:1096 (-),score=267.22 TRINITY_DN9597_c0_g1_i1:18-3044(-)
MTARDSNAPPDTKDDTVSNLQNENERLKSHNRKLRNKLKVLKEEIVSLKVILEDNNIQIAAPVATGNRHSLDKRDSLKKNVKDSPRKSKKQFEELELDLSAYERTSHHPIMDKDDLSQRDRLVIEILTTEQSFNTGLTILIKNFLEPLTGYAAENDKLDETDIRGFFSNLELLKILSDEFCKALEGRLDTFHEEDGDQIGDILLEWAGKFRPMRTYSSVYQLNMDKVAELCKNSSGFRRVFDARNLASSEYKGLEFKSYFVTPVQRVPRYRMLFEDLLKKTPEDHPDMESLTQATEKILVIAMEVNEHIKSTEGQINMSRIIAKGGGFTSLLSKPHPYGSDRYWVKDSKVDIIECSSDTKKGTKKEAELILFNDIIVAGNFVTKKAHPNGYHQPLDILWVEPKLGSFESLSETGFKITGPETTWNVGLNSDYERGEWITSITEMMNLPEGVELEKGKRSGKYEFLNWGMYEGEFLNGHRHGYGKMIRDNGFVFDGFWNNEEQAGFGAVTDPTSGETYLSGWREHRETYEIVPVREEHWLWGREEMSERDWGLILTGASRQIKQENDPIIEEGKKNSCLYRIQSGQLRVEKIGTDGNTMVLATMSAGTIFGETAVLKGISKATASVVADHDGVELSSISINILFEIFRSHPGSAMRFYRELAIKLSGKLRNLTQDKKKAAAVSSDSTPIDDPDNESVTESETESVTDTEKKRKKKNKYADDENQKLWMKFELPPTEILISDFNCILKQKLKKVGHLYIFQGHIAFESKVFGHNNKEKIDLGRVTSITEKKNNIVICIKKKKWVFGDVPNFGETLNLITSLWESSASISETEKYDSLTRTRSMRSHTEILDYSMTGKDWDLLLTVAELREFQPGDYIIEEGTENQRIYQIAQGLCTVTKETAKGTQILAEIDGGILGEMTFLERGPASASVVAGENGASVYIIEGFCIHSLFVNNPDLAGRFFSYIAEVIAERLDQREKEMNKSKSRRKRNKKKSISARRRKKHHHHEDE